MYIMNPKGNSILDLFSGLGKAAATGLSAVKPVKQGCGKCPDKAKQKMFHAPRIRRPR